MSAALRVGDEWVELASSEDGFGFVVEPAMVSDEDMRLRVVYADRKKEIETFWVFGRRDLPYGASIEGVTLRLPLLHKWR